MNRRKKTILSLLFLVITMYILIRYTDFPDTVKALITTVKNKIETMNDTPYHSSVAGDFDESILGNEYHYYYTQLDDDDKLIYRQIYFAMDNAPSPVVLATSDGDKVSEIQQYVILDNPQFFHFSKGQYSVGSTLTFSEISEMSDSEIENAQRAIDNYTSAALSGIDGASSEYDKALHVYEYIIKNTDYVENAPYNQNMYSVVKGQTVCQGYSMMFKYLCDQLGIQSIVVIGTVDGSPHAWNMACLDGNWCYIDCTHGDNDYLGKGIGYNWFGVNDSIISNNRTITYKELLPQAVSLENDYYYRNGIFLDTYSLKTIQNMCVGQNYITVKFSTMEAYDKACNDLFVNNMSKYLVVSKNGGSITYIQDDNSQTIFISLLIN